MSTATSHIGAGNHANQFSLGLLQLVMKPAQHAVRGSRVIVLNEVAIDSNIAQGSLCYSFPERILDHRRRPWVPE